MYYLSDFCLLCLNSKQLESILVIDDNGIAVQEPLKYFLPEITISKSGSPEFICSFCRTTLQSFYKFRKTCLENYTRFLQYTQILQNNIDQRGQKFSALQIQINNLDLSKRKQVVNNELNIKEEIGDGLQKQKQTTNVINIKEENDLIFSDLQNQINNQELINEREQDCNPNIKIENLDSLQSLTEGDDKTVENNDLQDKEFDGKSNINIDQILVQTLNEDFDRPVENVALHFKEEFGAFEDSEYLKCVKNEPAWDNEENCDSWCEDDNQPDVDEANFSTDTENVTCNNLNTAEPINHKTNKYFNSLSAHMIIKKNVRYYKCQICSREFLRKSSFSYHMKVHTGIKKFECYICKKKFIYKSLLKAHIKLHIGIREFKCTICNKMFVQKNYLTEHMKRHAGVSYFKCSLCDKQFIYQCRLKTHMKMHAGIKDFKCSICHMEFAEKISLNRHMLKHTKTNNFVLNL